MSTADPLAMNLAERLGFDKSARLLMIHADDAGMCHTANVATIKAMTEGVVSTASVMVPCPWFPEFAAWARENPQADVGVHLTLTSEWKYYRWRPVAPIDQVPSLLDPEGYLWHHVPMVIQHAKPEEVEIEIRAQIERARQFGIRPTHVDSHMGTLFHDPRFFEVYVRVSKEMGVLPMLVRPTPEVIQRAGDSAAFRFPVNELTPQGYFFLDQLTMSWEGKSFDERRDHFYGLIKSSPPGISEVIVHLNGEDEEARNIAGTWRQRYYEFLLCTSQETKDLLDQEGIQLIGYRTLAQACEFVKD